MNRIVKEFFACFLLFQRWLKFLDKMFNCSKRLLLSKINHSAKLKAKPNMWNGTHTKPLDLEV